MKLNITIGSKTSLIVVWKKKGVIYGSVNILNLKELDYKEESKN